jgi:hypothetical protein
MKKLTIFILSIFYVSNLYSQIAISSDGSAPHTSAQLDVKSTTKAFYPPRMGAMQKYTLANVQPGAIVYDTDLNALSIYNGSDWINVEKSANEFTAKSYIYSEINNNSELLANNFSKIGHMINDIQVPTTINSPVQIYSETSKFILGRIDPKVLSIPNNKFVIWGGTDNFGLQSSGAIYDAINDSWELIPDMNESFTRTEPMVAWVNDKLLVYGGTNNVAGLAFLTSGKIYNPTTKLWTSMNPTNAPSGRANNAFGYNSATNEFVVWGGQNSTLFFANGAKYNINTNTWATMNNTGAPTGRAKMGYGLNNGKLFLFGGFNATNLYNDAYYYDVASNVWSTVPPSGLSSKTNDIYYSGNSYIVFGPSTTAIEGAVFNTNTNTWAPMSTAGMPNYFSARYWVSNGYFMTNGGFVYNIATNTWSQLPILYNFDRIYAGNNICIFAFGGISSPTVSAANVLGGHRFFWVATPIIKHENKILPLYLYKKN